MTTEITSGTVNATPLGDLWLGTIEVLSTSGSDTNTINLDTLIGSKIKEVVFAKGVRESQKSGSADVSPISWTTGTAVITFGRSGTQSGTDTSGTLGIDDGRGTIGPFRRDIFFLAKSQQ